MGKSKKKVFISDLKLFFDNESVKIEEMDGGMEKDEWGMDPRVKFLRRVFSQIESEQRVLLQHLGISPFDERLRRIRDGALRIFENAWHLAFRRNLPMDEKDIVNLYLYSLAHIIERYSIDVPFNLLPSDERTKKLVQEATK